MSKKAPRIVQIQRRSDAREDVATRVQEYGMACTSTAEWKEGNEAGEASRPGPHRLLQGLSL